MPTKEKLQEELLSVVEINKTALNKIWQQEKEIDRLKEQLGDSMKASTAESASATNQRRQLERAQSAVNAYWFASCSEEYGEEKEVRIGNRTLMKRARRTKSEPVAQAMLHLKNLLEYVR